MAATSGERREVAARLRKCGAELSIIGADCETAFHVIDEVIGCRELESWERFLGRLADLIDPKCRNIAIKPADVLFCSECGEYVDIAYVENADDYHARYCPNCGCRCVNDGEVSE